jgi:3-deoxy-D-manno-octulosonic-acid transferase
VNRALRVAYGTAGQLARVAAALAPAGTGKWRRSLRARKGIRARYARWATRRDLRRPLLWMHAPSVGEGLQARVVLDLVRARHPDVQLAYTFYSPSAEAFANTLSVDFVDYLPFDTIGDARAAMESLRPSALIFSKVDVWPLLVEEAARRGVRLGLVSATLSEISSRRGGMAAGLLRNSYRKLERVGAVSAADAERLIRLGVRQDALVITGDTRYDQAWERARRANREGPLLRRLVSSRPTLVAGSTWPADEAVLLRAWNAIRRDAHDARLIIAPHEPLPRHLESIEAWANANRHRHSRLDAGEAVSADVIIVDRVGVLGDLYALADAAFVGGGFHGAGLHSVLEPAAFGAPVAFGPQHAGSRDAELLLKEGGGQAVDTVDETIEVLLHWLGDRELRETAGRAARGVVESGIGAGERSYELVRELLRG